MEYAIVAGIAVVCGIWATVLVWHGAERTFQAALYIGSSLNNTIERVVRDYLVPGSPPPDGGLPLRGKEGAEVSYTVSVWYRAGEPAEGRPFAGAYEEVQWCETYPDALAKLEEAKAKPGAAIWAITSRSSVVLLSGDAGEPNPSKL